MVASMKYKNGVYGTMNFNANSIWPQVPVLTIYGTEGILQLADPDRFGGKVLLQKKGCQNGLKYRTASDTVKIPEGLALQKWPGQ